MNRSDTDKIISWYLALTMSGYTPEQAYLLIAQAIRDERIAASA